MLIFVSDWSGFWQEAFFRSNNWETTLNGNTNITLDSILIDVIRFATEFIVWDDGTTLSYVNPDFVILLGFLTWISIFKSPVRKIIIIDLN